MSKPVAGQSNDAAERSAHVTRGGPEVPEDQRPPNFIRLPDGTTRIRRIHELEQEVKALREENRAFREASLARSALSQGLDPRQDKARIERNESLVFMTVLVAIVSSIILLAWVLL